MAASWRRFCASPRCLIIATSVAARREARSSGGVLRRRLRRVARRSTASSVEDGAAAVMERWRLLARHAEVRAGEHLDRRARLRCAASASIPFSRASASAAAAAASASFSCHLTPPRLRADVALDGERSTASRRRCGRPTRRRRSDEERVEEQSSGDGRSASVCDSPTAAPRAGARGRAATSSLPSAAVAGSALSESPRERYSSASPPPIDQPDQITTPRSSLAFSRFFNAAERVVPPTLGARGVRAGSGPSRPRSSSRVCTISLASSLSREHRPLDPKKSREGGSGRFRGRRRRRANANGNRPSNAGTAGAGVNQGADGSPPRRLDVSTPLGRHRTRTRRRARGRGSSFVSVRQFAPRALCAWGQQPSRGRAARGAAARAPGSRRVRRCVEVEREVVHERVGTVSGRTRRQLAGPTFQDTGANFVTMRSHLRRGTPFSSGAVLDVTCGQRERRAGGGRARSGRRRTCASEARASEGAEGAERVRVRRTVSDVDEGAASDRGRACARGARRLAPTSVVSLMTAPRGDVCATPRHSCLTSSEKIDPTSAPIVRFSRRSSS